MFAAGCAVIFIASPWPSGNAVRPCAGRPPAVTHASFSAPTRHRTNGHQGKCLRMRRHLQCALRPGELCPGFDEEGALEHLEAFTSLNGPAFYNRSANTRRITLQRRDHLVPEHMNGLVPFHAGEICPGPLPVHLIKFSSEDCGTCHRMSHYDGKVAEELGSFLVMLRDGDVGNTARSCSSSTPTRGWAGPPTPGERSRWRFFDRGRTEGRHAQGRFPHQAG